MKPIAFVLLLCSVIPAAAQDYPAAIVRVTDGDTLVLSVPAWKGTPFQTIPVRIVGIDTPEKRKPPAKCVTEVKKGLAAQAFAKTLAQPGDLVILTYLKRDKFFRIDGKVKLADGRDWATAMIASGMAVPYTGSGPKKKWCQR